MVSHSGKAGVWFAFSTGHLGFSWSVPSMVQDSMSNAASAEGKERVFVVVICIHFLLCSSITVGQARYPAETSVNFLLSCFLYLDMLCARLIHGEKKAKFWRSLKNCWVVTWWLIWWSVRPCTEAVSSNNRQLWFRQIKSLIHCMKRMQRVRLCRLFIYHCSPCSAHSWSDWVPVYCAAGGECVAKH